MTAPPRPEWRNYPPILDDACCGDPPWPCWEVAKQWHAYAEHLERYIEQLEAQLHEPAEPLDPFWGDREPD